MRTQPLLGWFALALTATTLLPPLPPGRAAEIAPPITVDSDSATEGRKAQRAFNGKVNDPLGWVTPPVMEPHWMTVTFERRVTLRAADLYTGTAAPDSVLENFVLQVPDEQAAGGWRDVPGTRVEDNRQHDVRLILDPPVATQRLRLWIPNAGGNGTVRLREMRFWKAGADALPAMEKVETEQADERPVVTFDRSRHLVFLNQSGFNTAWPKRFTAPLTPDNTEFTITPLHHPGVLFRGKVVGGVGDFSGFQPPPLEHAYLIRVAGSGELREGLSDPFHVAPHWMQRVSLEPALRFFVDCRSLTGTHPGAFGAGPWRDAPYYAYSFESLVHLYLSNPAFFRQQKVEMNWRRDLARVLAPGFVHDPDAGEEPLKTLARMQRELDGPVGDHVPDIVQLIHWGTGWWLLKPESKDYAGTDFRLHPETVAGFAFFLYAHPWMKEYFTPKFRQAVADFAYGHWEKAGLFEVQREIGTFKGRSAPGWTILPNLMMHEVAKAEGRADAARFLDAAAAQAAWMMELDFADPLVTKGQRMSEHKSLTGLAALLAHYPDRAPRGLAEKLRAWADVAVSRSANLWDYRRYDGGENWSLPAKMPGMTGGGSSWNDPGNLAGFPALAWHVSDALDPRSPEDQARRDRLHEIAVSQWDILFGRNPLGAHSAWRGGLDWTGVERGWPVKYERYCAILENVRGTLNSSPATEHFPFNPAGTFRHAEGWTAFNAAFNVALAESVRREIAVSFRDADDRVVPVPSVGATATKLLLEGPIFAPELTVTVWTDHGDRETLTLTATDYLRDTFTAPLPGATGALQPGDGVLQLDGANTLTVEYGHGFFAATKRFSLK